MKEVDMVVLNYNFNQEDSELLSNLKEDSLFVGTLATENILVVTPNILEDKLFDGVHFNISVSAVRVEISNVVVKTLGEDADLTDFQTYRKASANLDGRLGKQVKLGLKGFSNILTNVFDYSDVEIVSNMLEFIKDNESLFYNE